MPVVIEEPVLEQTSGFWLIRNIDLYDGVTVTVSEDADWIETEKSFSLEGNEEKAVPYVFKGVTLDGETFAAVFFAPETRSPVVARIGCGVYAWPAKMKPVPKLKLSLSANSDVISVEAENSGNIHLRPQFTVKVFRKETELFSSFSPLGIPVRKGEKRRYSLHDKLPRLEDGKYAVLIETNFGVPYKFKNKIIQRKYVLTVKNGAYEIK